MEFINPSVKALDPLHGESHQIRQAFHRWYLQAKIPQVRYTAFLTTVLYLAYVAIEQRVATESLDLRLLVHGILVPGGLIAIGCMSFFQNLYRFMGGVLIVAPVFVVAANLFLNFRQAEAAYFMPEIYLSIICTFIISGLSVRKATLTASISVLITLVATSRSSFDAEFIQLHLLWVAASFLFGLVSAYKLENVYKSIFLQQRHLVHLAQIDGLTGLWNRSQIDQLLTDECERAGRYGTRFSIILCDIDHFKKVNDNHGHTVGDSVLRAVSSQLQGHVRHTDKVGRMGGEEFLVLLPETGVEQAQKVAQTLKNSVSETRFEGVEKLTVSMGVAEYSEGDDPISLVRRADQALYGAKGKGRDRVETARQVEDMLVAS